MKKLIIILAFIPLFCNAQEVIEPPLSIGDELIEAKKLWYAGMITSVMGAGLVASSLLLGGNGSEEMAIAGGAMQLLGLALIAGSWSHIGKAGNLMNEKKIGLTFNNGIGLRYRI